MRMNTFCKQMCLLCLIIRGNMHDTNGLEITICKIHEVIPTDSVNVRFGMNTRRSDCKRYCISLRRKRIKMTIIEHVCHYLSGYWVYSHALYIILLSFREY